MKKAYFLQAEGEKDFEVDISALNAILNNLKEGASLRVRTVEPHEFAVPGPYPTGAPSLRTFPEHPKYGLCDECELPQLHPVHI